MTAFHKKGLGDFNMQQMLEDVFVQTFGDTLNASKGDDDSSISSSGE